MVQRLIPAVGTAIVLTLAWVVFARAVDSNLNVVRQGVVIVLVLGAFLQLPVLAMPSSAVARASSVAGFALAMTASGAASDGRISGGSVPLAILGVVVSIAGILVAIFASRNAKTRSVS